MNDKDTAALPWYRHRWPWFLMAGPAVVVVAGFITLALAIRSNDGLVADDYYKQGLAINQTTARDQAATRLGLQAQLMLGGQDVRILLKGNADVVLPETLNLRITHPTRSGDDQLVAVRQQAPGLYSGKLAQGLSGRWLVSVEDAPREWRLTGEWVPEKTPVLVLPK